MYTEGLHSMREKVITVLALAVAAVVALVLLGCTGQAAPTPTPAGQDLSTTTPTPTPKPTATPTALPTPDPLSLTLPYINDGVTVQSGVLVVVGMTNQDAAVAINGIPADVGPNGIFIYELALEEGLNYVEVVATDIAGQNTSQGATVFYLPPESGIPLDLFYPVDGLEVNEPGLLVVGATSQDAAVAVNGIPTEVTASGVFRTMLALEEGANLVEITASDVQGLTRSQTASVFYIIP